ncbi:phage tail sheath C-terminal domain-containing protein [uncultured Oscillibacter sp.]|uniref:phage tail sheath C-terminal domain-containing protein n=1 Tax=uncultured Oscillibacter sp. TaxID=876091 RepID=UPI00261B2B88|nr:phage tail sheath C-terminal domain-containing protein [uncultured Oscillibacter sp.]
MAEKLTMPTLTILFQQRAQTTIARSRKGVAALIVRDALTAGEAWSLTSTGQIPEKLGKVNQDAIRRVFKGGVNPPRKVLVYCLGEEDTMESGTGVQAEGGESTPEEPRPGSGAAALRWLGTQRFDYLAGPADLSEAEAAVIQEWIIQKREDDHVIFKAVLPGCAADSEGVVNFTASGIQVGGDVFDAAGYCGRVAGLIAGTPMKQSVTYAALPEVEDIHRLSALEEDEAVGRGELILTHDGEKVKLGRGVNSLTNTTGRSEVWRKIKIVELLDLLQWDLRLAIQDNYIGKFQNSYDNKLLLITAVKLYLQALAKDQLIEDNFSCDIDVEEQDAYLQSVGVATAEMTEQQIREANTGTYVFLVVDIRPIDAIEDVRIKIYL